MGNSTEPYSPTIGIQTIKILGENMYSEFSFAIGEIIANSHDANAKNIFLSFDGDSLTVTDDGKGMSDAELRKTFLHIGPSDDSKRDKNKMGRKGIGKLAALFVSDIVEVISKKDNVSSGFIMSLNPDVLIPDKDKKAAFPPLPAEKLTNKIVDHGTEIRMLNVAEDFSIKVVKESVLEIFEGYKDLNVYINGKKLNFAPRIIKENLLKIIQIGDIDIIFPKSVVVEKYPSPKFEGYETSFNGWIGVYDTINKEVLTRNGIRDNNQINRIRIYSRKKLGQPNILNEISKNRVGDRYISGFIYADILEEGADIALPNRQGYNSADFRYIELRNHLSGYVSNLVNWRAKYKKDIKTKSLDDQKKELLRKQSVYISNLMKEVEKLKLPKKAEKEVKEITRNAATAASSGIKSKRMILLSHWEPKVEEVSRNDYVSLSIAIDFLIKILEQYNFSNIETAEDTDSFAIIASSKEGYKVTRGDFWEYVYDNAIKDIEGQPGVLLNLYTSKIRNSFNSGIEAGMAFAASATKRTTILDSSKPNDVPGVWRNAKSDGLSNIREIMLGDFRTVELLADSFKEILSKFGIKVKKSALAEQIEDLANDKTWQDILEKKYKNKYDKLSKMVHHNSTEK